ncbi:MAG: rubrerythrin [Candidatus Hydrogenedentota bacterium]|jgi:rubrerythrin|uniref:Putative transmembrane iron-regulated protein n=1 Tax=Sumerlaea chitinivorans TaxID=2250252 RepID=A0A2Z4Y8D1_SUMC1|nr:putative transmembrane iron-regulated protein [Candidatus Sumerlaea chitinivorans]RMH28886.1 MAG: rubrerythrin [Candidatus Hydrogenedentota bacterium]
MKRSFASLSTPEVLALAIALEEEDARIIQEFARQVRATHPDFARQLDELRAEEEQHRRSLLELFRKKFGDEIPLIRREDVIGFVDRPPLPPEGLTPEEIAEKIALMELETQRFYERAAERTTDAEMRALFADLAEVERAHEAKAIEVTAAVKHVAVSPRHTERQLFVLQVIQPALVGLMDGSVSTLAPLFAAAIATKSPWETFLVGTAASVGAGISMGFAEGLSDDGALTGRGRPLMRGLITGFMTFLGGIGHALPFLLKNLTIAMWLAVIVVIVELFAIAYIRYRWMATPFSRSLVQVVFGGLLVVAAGFLIGEG